MPAEVSYQFLPWVRSGLAATLTNADTLDPGTPGRARLDVTIDVDRRAGPGLTVPKQLALLGPGDIVGLDPRQVIRTDPASGVTDSEPNLLVQVELDRPDLPWLFTPAAATAGQRLRPWLVLVVMPEGPGVILSRATGGRLPMLELTGEAEPGRQLPDLGESWAWAHGQVVLLPGETVDDVLDGVPQRTAARLVCPRRLEPMTRYLAALVPAFEAGRRSGLSLEPDPADEAGLHPAWTADSTAVDLPVYYSFEFSTGAGGDFESLARALRPRPLPEGVGRQSIYVGAGGQPLPDLSADADGAVVELSGALVPPDSEPAPWPDATRSQVESGLTSLLDAPARRVTMPQVDEGTDTDPAVTAPLYGQWQAASPTVPGPDGVPAWLRSLNLDPRHRAVAGLGSLIVVAEQERLMDQAWSQVGQVETANRELRWAQLAREVRGSLLRRHIQPLPAADTLAVTATVHPRLPARSTTVAAAITASRLPDAVVSRAFRRTLGPRSALLRRVASAAGAQGTPPRQFIVGLDSGGLRMGSTRPPPDGLFGFINPAPARQGVPKEVTDAVTAARAAAGKKRPASLDPGKLGKVTLTPAMAGRVTGSLGLSTSAGMAVARQFQAAALETARRAATLASVPPDPAAPTLGVDDIVIGLLARLDPRLTVTARLRGRITMPDSLRPRPGRDPLEEVMAAPRFPQPAWELIRDYAPDLLLPGMHHLPQDTATLAETNPAFAEAALVGLNHEVSRELLWREYPTDQRGTCFHRFWAPGGSDDIAPIDRWSGGELGSNTAGGADARLVLVLRGRLLFRYPGTVIYAAPDRNGRPDITDGSVLLPTLRGRVEPDIAFCGFPLGRDEAVGTPGWWFILEEQPTAPRFGLDVATRFGAEAGPVNEWNDLSWGHLAADAAALAGLTNLRADFQPPSPPTGPRWGSTAAAMAAILAQQPVRIALRAVDLLPPPPGGTP